MLSTRVLACPAASRLSACFPLRNVTMRRAEAHSAPQLNQQHRTGGSWSAAAAGAEAGGGGAQPAAGAGALGDAASHNEYMRAYFSSPDTLPYFVAQQPDEVEQRLAAVVASVPGLGPSSRVIDVGAGTGCLVPHFLARGVVDVLAVDLCEPMLAELARRHSLVEAGSSKLGNSACVRTWCGDIMELPPYQGPADAFFFNGMFGNMWSPRDALLKAALMLRPGGHIVISHPLGSAWHRDFRAEKPELVPHCLPNREQLQALVADLPLTVANFRDEEGLYLALLQVPPSYALQGGPVRLDGPVVRGFGRGSRQMGVPTANIDPEPLAGILEGMPKGVYFGWAQLDAPPDWPEADRAVHKMVMNVGRRPTVEQGNERAAVTVEAHVMHTYSGDFYGLPMRVVALGYIRPEMRFPGGIVELIARIRADVAIAKYALDEPAYKAATEQLGT
ncbi:hypothetical protein FOA52_013773 [Chlamydomonas sp. UWO 241]|nr:hypothetical protein FOA52_013773 [Chlamydomonas sp. UWO 241]